MGKNKHIAAIESLFRRSPIVSSSSIKKIIKKDKKSSTYYKQVIRNLIAKDRIKKLAKGYYTIHNNISLAVFCFKPAYFGLQDALSFHDLWEQESIPVILTSRKIRPGARTMMNSRILIRRIDKKYFFGLEYKKEGDFFLPYSDIEKTFIDMVYFNERLSQEAIINIKKKADRKKINLYLKKYPKKFQKRALSLLEN
ncbi:hypothetical protein J4466_04220 [Candidatus Pacearchaeota archaeon]|nr:hypothetical protein [Candidatus Pacearchaeota archaeon]